MRTLLLSLLLSFSAGAQSLANHPGQWPLTGQPVPELASVEQALLPFLQNNNIPGATLAIVRDGRLVYVRGFGWQDLESRTLVDPFALARAANLANPLTAAATLRLAELGKLSLDDKVTTVLASIRPPSGSFPDSRWNSITIRHLLQHSGGWQHDATTDPLFRQRDIAAAMGVPSPPSTTTIIRYMMDRNLDFSPGSRYYQSNFGYVLLGRVIEQVTRLRYDDAVYQLVLQPAGITSFRAARSFPQYRAPGENTYYDESGAAAVPSVDDTLPGNVLRPYGGFGIEAMDASAGWLASAPDLARFAAVLDGRRAPRLLSPASFSAIIAPPSYAGSGSFYGLGWNVRPIGPTDATLFHYGALPGSWAILHRAGVSGISWALLLNTRNSARDTLLPEIEDAINRAFLSVSSWPAGDQFRNDAAVPAVHSLRLNPVDCLGNGWARYQVSWGGDASEVVFGLGEQERRAGYLSVRRNQAPGLLPGIHRSGMFGRLSPFADPNNELNRTPFFNECTQTTPLEGFRQVTVQSNGSAVRTGLLLQQGARVRILAGGVWCWGTGPNDCSTPAGTLGRPGIDDARGVLASARQGELLGRIGITTFPLGSAFEAGDFVVPVSGELELLMNDRVGGYGDNRGTVTVLVPSSPSTPIPPVNRRAIVTHIAAGEGWNTEFTIVNLHPNRIAQTANVKFFDSFGNPLRLTLADGRVVNELDVPIPPTGTASFRTNVPPSIGILQGWAEITAPEYVAGQAVFQLSLPLLDVPLQQAAVPFSTPGKRNFSLVFDESQGYVSGIAINNADRGVAARVQVSAFDRTGASLGFFPLDLPPGGHIAFVLGDRLETAKQRTGTVVLESNTEITAIGLRFSPQRAFTSLFPRWSEPAYQGPGRFLLSQLAYEGTWTTTTFLGNYLATRANTNLSTWKAPAAFVDGLPTWAGAGDPWFVSYTEQLPGTSVTGGLGKNELFVATTRGGSPDTTIGFSEVETNNPLAGLAIFRQFIQGRISQEASVPLLSAGATRLIVLFNDRNGASTGIAVANSRGDRAVTVAATLRDSSGSVLATRSFPMPARSHFAATLQTLFPQAANRFGTLELSSSDSGLAALGLRFVGSAFTSLPAVEVE
jgi:N-acyl-D-amino-acid deacylase